MVLHVGPSRLYVDSAAFGLNPQNNRGKSKKKLNFTCFKLIQAQILRKYPRRSCGSFWSSLELWRPKVNRFRPNLPIVFVNKCMFL